MRMKFMRIFPEMWARTLWPVSSWTRNMALGSGSTTVPSTSMASSRLAGSGPFWAPRPFAPLPRTREHLRAVLGNGHGMFEMGREGPIRRHGGPSIRQDLHLGAPGVHHWLDGPDHPREEHGPAPRRPEVRDLRLSLGLLPAPR